MKIDKAIATAQLIEYIRIQRPTIADQSITEALNKLDKRGGQYAVIDLHCFVLRSKKDGMNDKEIMKQITADLFPSMNHPNYPRYSADYRNYVDIEITVNQAFTKIVDYCAHTLGITRDPAITAMMDFMKGKGSMAVLSLYGFIRYAQTRNIDLKQVKSTIVHDLNGATDHMLTPRSIEYWQFANS